MKLNSQVSGSARSAAKVARKLMGGLLVGLVALASSHPAHAQIQTFTVINTGDNGPGSLRQAIIDANADTGLENIEFAIPIFTPGQLNVISLASPLPVITSAVSINGYTQSGSTQNTGAVGTNASPKIVLNGGRAGAGADGLVFTGGGSSVSGLVINSFTGTGIRITTNDVVAVYGCFIGTDETGTSAFPNGGGISVEGVTACNIGGNTANLRNLISGNTTHGVRLSTAANDNFIQGNLIGTNAAGSGALGNGGLGIYVEDSSNIAIGGNTTAHRNIISGNNTGIQLIDATGVSIQGNYIGVDATGGIDLGNVQEGILTDGGSGHVIGGVINEGNVISGNGASGVMLSNSPIGGHALRSNYIGTDATGVVSIANGSLGVQISSTSNNNIGGTSIGDGNIISGNLQGGISIVGAPASPSTFNFINGNLIGVGATNLSLANLGAGITISDNSTNNSVGSASSTVPNTISASGTAGIVIEGTATDNHIRANHIGTDTTGTTAIPNAADGVQLYASGNFIGGSVAGEGNVISGNSQAGISVSFATSGTIQGNTIGLNVAGNAAISNNDGIVLESTASGITIGGSTAAERNIISGNSTNGIEANGASNCSIFGNYIGTDINGTAVIPGNADGLLLSGTNGILIGSSTPGTGNVIVGSFFGISIQGAAATANQIRGNHIGVDATGSVALPNSIGIGLLGTNGNIVGGVISAGIAPGNVISGNSDYGILMSDADGNDIRSNLIGTNAAGTASLGAHTAVGGIVLTGGSSGNFIGFPSVGSGNTISGLAGDGIVLSAANTTGNQIAANRIGVGLNGTTAVPNTGNGVFVGVDANNNIIGSTTIIDPAASNTIANNKGNGVAVEASVTAIRANSIYNNGDPTDTNPNTRGIGINLIDANDATRRVTANDALDVDTGANGLLNYPTLAVTGTSGTNIQVTATINGLPSTSFDIDLYRSPAASLSGFGEGQTYIQSANVTTDSLGMATTVFLVPQALIGQFFSATANRTVSNYETSEFGPALELTATAPETLTVNVPSPSFSEAGGPNVRTGTVTRSGSTTSALTINITSSDTSEVTVQTPVTIAAGQTSTTFAVNAINDAGADGNQTVTITASTSVAGYTLGTTNVTVTDDDTAGITINPISGLLTTEAGGKATFTVILRSQPTSNVVIGLSSSDTGEGTVSVPQLTFTSSNWNTPRTVTITGVNDGIADGDQPYSTITAVATSADADYQGINPPDVSVTNNDIGASGITVTPTSGLITTEAGGSASFTVRLNSQPSSNVVIGLSSSDTGEGTISVPQLTFTRSNWNAARTVTVTGVDDAITDGDQPYSIVTALATSSDAFYNNLNASDVLLTNRDIGVAGITVTPTSGLTTTEAGGKANFTVVLNTQPTSNVVIGLSSSDTGEGTIAVPQLTFTRSNWNMSRTVTITGVNDGIADGNQSYTIVTATATSGDTRYQGINALDVSVTNTDIGVPGIIVTPTSGLVTTEFGGRATFTVRLNTQPTANVQIDLSSNNPTEGTISLPRLTFTRGNWNVARSVTITGINDNVVDGDKVYSIVTAAATSGDGNYSGRNASDVSVTNRDVGVSGVLVTPTAGLVTSESGKNANFSVRLTGQPTSNVVIGLSSSDTGEGTVELPQLTFTPSNWNTPRTVTITGVGDGIADGDQPYSIITAPASSSDTKFAGINASDISVTNTDNGVPGILVTPTTGLSTTEAGATATFTVQLTGQPSANVVIGLSSSDTTEGTVSISQLTFNYNTWNIPRTVTITGVEDNIDDGDQAYTIITAPATSSDSRYQGMDASNVAVINLDNDPTLGLLSWGYNQYGQLGTDSTATESRPVRVVEFGTVTKVSAGGGHSVAINNQSSVTLTSAGYNTSGQLGDGTLINRDEPVTVNGLTNIIAISAGWYHTLALRSDGTVWAWGNNLYGQLGDGTKVDRSQPVQISGLSEVTSIAAGTYHSAALVNGRVWTWGNNFYGQLGDGTTVDRMVPTLIPALNEVSAISTGGAHTLALIGGTVRAWGWNEDGQLGNNTFANSAVPVTVSNLSGVSAISAGYGHSLALVGGEVRGWGHNGYGQLGNGTLIDCPIPVTAIGLSDADAIAAGGAHSIARHNAGKLAAWGNNLYGSLGDGTTSNSSVPQEVPGISDVTAFSAGYAHNLAVGLYSAPSPIRTGVNLLSSAKASTSAVSLHWTKQLDTASASRASSYRVHANGKLLTVITSYNAATQTTTLRFPSSLRVGTQLMVEWSGLRDSKGAAVDNGYLALTVK
jgi:parallel beta-helix repeat protein